MTKLSNITRLLIVLAIIAVTSTVSVAQNYYDDDIYYDASKAKKEQNKQVKKQNVNEKQGYYTSGKVSHVSYPSADTYVVPDGSLNMDVDAYNRRGQFLVSDSVAADQSPMEDFAYTQRIERFHNPDIVYGSDDDELKHVYSYAMQQPQNINIYVVDNDPWSYYGPSWSWRYGNPWYWNTWGPSWGWSWSWNSWAWDPYWSWSVGWGPSWSWGWRPSWSWTPGWGHSWCGPVHAWHPVRPSTSRPYRPIVGGSTATHRPGSYTPSNSHGVTSRPGNMGRGRYTYPSSSSDRPGNYKPSGNGNSGSSVSRPGNMGRGRSSMTGNNNYNSNNRNSYNNDNGYRQSSNSNGAFRQSGGSRGYSGSHGSMGGGGSNRGGGGSSRGRR